MELSAVDKIAIILTPFILATLSWKFIEQPFRNPKRPLYSKTNAALGALLCAGVLAFALPTIVNQGRAFWHGAAINEITDLSVGGSYPERTFDKTIKAQVIGNGAPSVALIGDSHAHAISPAFEGAKQTTLVLHNECFLLPDLIQTHNAEACIANTQKQAEFLNNHPEITDIFLAQRWNSRTEDWHRYFGLNRSNYLQAREDTLTAFIQAIAAPNRRIHIIAEVPAIQSRAQNVPSIYVRLKLKDQLNIDTFAPSRSAYERDEAHIITMMQRIANKTHADIIWPHKALCPQERCTITDNKRFYYWDDDHLSRYGALTLTPLVKDALNINTAKH